MMTSRTSPLTSFVAACFSWFVITFPSSHLREIYIWHHNAKGAAGLHPELVDSYIRKACWQAIALAVLAPFVIWMIERLCFRGTNSTSSSLWAGPIIGLITAMIMHSGLKQDFLAITNVGLGDGSFLYSGLLSGLIIGELCRRYCVSAAGIQATGEGLRRRFLISALMTWAVLLKVLESFYLASLPPGREPFGIHMFMFASVLLWTPLLSSILWRLRPSTFLPTAVLTVAAGIIAPYAVGWLLLYPVVISLYAGITPSIYGMLWGRLLLNMSWPTSLVATVFVAPGLVWGVIVAVLWLGVRATEKRSPMVNPLQRQNG